MTEFSVDLATPILTLDDSSHRPGDQTRAPEPHNGLSYVVGDKTQLLSRSTVWQLLAHAAERFPSHEAAVFCKQNIRWTWTALRDEAERLASGFLALGITTGDRVGIWAPNTPEWLLVQFATARIGAVLVTINPAYRSAELTHALRLSGCACLVLADQHKSSNYIEMIAELAPELAEQERGWWRSA